MKTLQPECLQAALAYLKLGWSAIPLCPPNHEKVVHKGHLDSCHRPGKTPLWQWKGYQERLPRDTELKLWWNKNPYCNVGIALGPVSGLVGLDVDSLEGHGLLLQWSDGTAIPPTLEFKTPHGFRLFFKWQPGIPIQSFRNADNKEILRVLAKGSQTVLPPSKLAKGVYFWVPGHGPGEIEPAPLPEWLTPHLVVPSNTKGDDQGVGGDGFQIAQNTPPSPPNALERAIAYLTKCNPCVAGQGGHNQLFKVCCHLVHGLHLDQHSALFVLLQDYNGRCQPPWSEQELTHKIKEAAEKGTAPDMGPSKDSSSKWGEPAPPTKPEEKKSPSPSPTPIMTLRRKFSLRSNGPYPA